MKKTSLLLIGFMLLRFSFSQPTYFNTQEQIDSFQVNYPGVTGLSFLWIEGDDITNLEGLSVITTVDHALTIVECDNLNSLSGLQNLHYIGISAGLAWGLHITGNSSLKNLEGLDNLVTIAGRLEITSNDSLKSLSGIESLQSLGDGLFITDNPSLKSLSGLSNLTTVGNDGIKIMNNGQLTSLSGLENIAGGAVEYLLIEENDALSYCHVQSICDYLVSPNGTTGIHTNGPGCNSVAEVENACFTGIVDVYGLGKLTIHPNPASKESITLTLLSPHNLYLACFNTCGQQVHQQELNQPETVIHIGSWHPGIYLAIVYDRGKVVGRVKFVVQ